MKSKRVLVIGGYGNFGRFICQRLATEEGIELVIAGRSKDKAILLANRLKAEAAELDIAQNLTARFQALNPDIVIHTSGPFQDQAYRVAEAAIDCGAHYIDLADARDFVTNIRRLDEAAKLAKVLVVSGASSVPCLSAAVIDNYFADFKALESVDYGITTAQRMPKGLATTASILSYVGQAFTTLVNGNEKKIFGWQGLRLRKFKTLGWRWLSDCNVPDLALFPKRYTRIKTLQFSAGLESSFLHLALWLISWLVRARLILSLSNMARTMLYLSQPFDRFGSEDSGFYMALSGRGHDGEQRQVMFELIARDGDGYYIPCVPAILLAKKLAQDMMDDVGARPCVGLVDLREYLGCLDGLNISWRDQVSDL